jgi:thiamine biosynthesis lipoprotein
MGSAMSALIDSDHPFAIDALAATPGWFARWEDRLSRFRPDSELTRLNDAAGAPRPVSAVFWRVLQAALRVARATDGLVTPTVGAAVLAAGYDRDFAALRQGGAAPRAVAGPAPAWREIRTAMPGRRVTLPAGARLDFGGVAKGWAADHAARRLGGAAPALVDAGGDIAVSGPRPGGAPWPIGVADPRNPDADLTTLLLPAGAVATSGTDYRRWRQGAELRTHIIDPRTGRSADTDLLSVTVVGPTAVWAEAAAKATLILGGQAGLAWLDARPELAGLLIYEDGRVTRSRRLPQYEWS